MSRPYDHRDTPLGRLAHWLDTRVGAAGFARSKLRYVFPEQFSFLFGEVALYSFVVLVATGVFLSLFYTPSESRVVYEGAYAPLHGVAMSEAYASVVELSFGVRAGLLVRQTHHWAALVFLGAIGMHMARVFFTGAFRRPRELNWITGIILLIVAMLEGFLGYSLLDDMLSGAGLRIGSSVVESIPVIGSGLAFLMWGGEYPGTGFLSRAFVIHIFLFPAVLATLIAVHLALVFRQHHTQFPGPGRTERNVVGSRLWPTYATMSIGLLFLISAALVVMGGLLQINPVWLYGPYDPATVSSGSQADWYVLWLQGALRLMPPWELRLFGYTIPNPFFPGVLLPGLAFLLLFAWPFLEARVTGDRSSHHLLDRPRDRPLRTGLGAAGLTVLAMLLVAGSDDIIAVELGWSIVALRRVEQALLLVLPPLVGLLTARVCKDLAARERHEHAAPAAEPAAQRTNQPQAAAGQPSAGHSRSKDSR